MINELKEKICEVAENYDSQVKKCIYPKTIETHILPHERKVKIILNVGWSLYLKIEKNLKNNYYLLLLKEKLIKVNAISSWSILTI